VRRLRELAEDLDGGVPKRRRQPAKDRPIAGTRLGRILRLTLLAPNIVEAILNGRQPADITLAMLMKSFPAG